MVVRVPDAVGNMYSKGKVIVPCQCYYNVRDNILTEIIQQSFQQLKQNSNKQQECNKKSKNIEKQDAQTETEAPHCCICEYFKNLEMRKNKKDLWYVQFKRWLGWNWRRKKHFMMKFRQKFNENSNRNTTNYYTYENINLPDLKLPNSNEKVDIAKPIYEKVEPIQPSPNETTSGFKKPYIRRKRNKQKQRLYKGWIKEITSSESDSSIKNMKIKIKNKEVQSNKDYIKYLTRHLQNFTSESDDHKEFTPADNTNYVSPFSGKKYNLNLPETSTPNYCNTDYLKAVNIKDSSVIPRPLDWLKHYNLIKEEHNSLLQSINEVLCSPKDKNIFDSKKEIYNLNYTNYSEPIIENITKKTNNSVVDNIPINVNIMEPNLITFQPTLENQETEKNKNLHYDINYISNNLQSFASAISVTEFLQKE